MPAPGSMRATDIGFIKTATCTGSTRRARWPSITAPIRTVMSMSCRRGCRIGSGGATAARGSTGSSLLRSAVRFGAGEFGPVGLTPAPRRLLGAAGRLLGVIRCEHETEGEPEQRPEQSAFRFFHSCSPPDRVREHTVFLKARRQADPVKRRTRTSGPSRYPKSAKRAPMKAGEGSARRNRTVGAPPSRSRARDAGRRSARCPLRPGPI